VLMCGLPGAGKTTLARRLAEKGLWLRAERDEKRRAAQELGVDIELHYFDVPLDELVRRLEKRNSEGDPNAFRISRAEMEEYFKLFEPPDEAELALFPVSAVHRARS